METYAAQGQVRFLFRHFAFLGEESLWAAEASECAGEQGKFWEYHDKLFDEWRGEGTGTFSKSNLKSFAADLGLDMDSFNACLDSDRYGRKVREEKAEGQRLGVDSTPTVLINGRLVKGNQPFATYQAIIEEELAKVR